MNMAIRINTEKPHIPVEFGDLTFKFDISDDSIKKYRENSLKIQKELENMKIDENDDKAIDEIRKVLKKGYDLMLGEGTFDKVYKVVPSVVMLMGYFEQIATGIGEEL